MIKKITGFASALLLMIGLSGFTWADKYDITLELFRKSPNVAEFFKNAYGYAVFPVVGKGGFGVGGAHGKGKVYRKGQYVGTATLNQLTIGFQLGGQAFSQIVFFEDQTSYNEFTNGGFEFGAQATAVAITVGAQAQAGTTGTSTGASADIDEPGVQKAYYYKGMATFVHVKGGLMYEASIGGQKFNFKPAGQERAKIEKEKTADPVANNDGTGVATYGAGPIEPVKEVK